MPITVQLRREQGSGEFSCSLVFWDLMVELAGAFGWKSFGTGYTSISGKQVHGQTLRHGYKPGDWSDAKRVEGDDASAWATALTAARESPHLHKMAAAKRVEDQSISDAEFEEAMAAFIRYLRGGSFSFARMAEDDNTQA
jgi:hypothetical protein